MKVFNPNGEKIVTSDSTDRASLLKKLENLSSKKEKIDGEKNKTINYLDSSSWKIGLETEKIWKKIIKDEIIKHQELDFKKEMIDSFVHSYFLGLLFGIIYIIFEPSLLLFLFVFLPATSFVSSFLGFYKLKARWDSLISSLKEKL